VPEATPERRLRVLIVDDEADLVSILRFGFEVEGFEVLEANDGESGLARAQQAQPDAIILDLMLPKLDGYKVCRMLKFDERYRHIPVIILSARSSEEDRRLALEMGADTYLSKPYDVKELVAHIRRRLGLPAKGAESSPAAPGEGEDQPRRSVA
jgi:DNA-binding response OmpR family regulator